MNMKLWMSLLLVGMIALVSNGCKKKPAAGTQGLGPTDDRLTIYETPGYGESDLDTPDYIREGGTQILGADGRSPFEPVYFAYDSSQVAASERSKVEAVADYMRQNAQVSVIVEGHCDERGSREYNVSLGERRALAVRAYLVGLGIDGSRIQTKSFGEENPVASGHDEQAWSMNRRGEIIPFY